MSLFHFTDKSNRKIHFKFDSLSRHFGVSILAAAGDSDDDSAKEDPLIYAKDFLYMIPGRMEEYGSYHLKLEDTTENISGWVFDERINYFHEALGNYTLAMSKTAQGDGASSPD